MAKNVARTKDTLEAKAAEALKQWRAENPTAASDPVLRCSEPPRERRPSAQPRQRQRPPVGFESPGGWLVPTDPRSAAELIVVASWRSAAHHAEADESWRAADSAIRVELLGDAERAGLFDELPESRWWEPTLALYLFVQVCSPRRSAAEAVRLARLLASGAGAPFPSEVTPELLSRIAGVGLEKLTPCRGGRGRVSVRVCVDRVRRAAARAARLDHVAFALRSALQERPNPPDKPGVAGRSLRELRAVVRMDLGDVRAGLDLMRRRGVVRIEGPETRRRFFYVRQPGDIASDPGSERKTG